MPHALRSTFGSVLAATLIAAASAAQDVVSTHAPLAAETFDIVPLGGSARLATAQSQSEVRLFVIAADGTIGAPTSFPCASALVEPDSAGGVYVAGMTSSAGFGAASGGPRDGLPATTTGYDLASLDAAHVPRTGGSPGDLCLGGAIGRLNRPGEVGNSAGLGRIHLRLQLGDLPGPAGSRSALAGETWRFQTWYLECHRADAAVTAAAPPLGSAR